MHIDDADDFEDINWNNVIFTWHGDKPDWPNIDEIVREDCKQNLQGLAAVEELIFHNVLLGNNWDEHLVTVWGVEGDTNVLHCEYDASPQWVTLNPNDNDNLPGTSSR